MYDHIIIDEFQDTSEDQMLLIAKHLYQNGKGKSLMVCGDDAQSIFSFRDVDVKNILTFKDIYPDVIDFKILKNFRSTDDILYYANKILLWNEDRISKTLYSNRSGEKPRLYEGTMDDIVNEVKTLVDAGEDLKDIAVLSRTRRECVELHKRLNEANIDNVVVISNDVRADNQVQGMIALAKFVDDRNTDEQRLMEGAIWLRKSNNSEFESQYAQKEYILSKTKELLEEFTDLKVGVDERIDEVRYAWFMEKIKTAFERPSIALTTVMHKIEESEPSFYDVCDFLGVLDRCNAGMMAESDDRIYNAVTISTIHAAKGREWKNVVVNFLKMKGFKFEKEWKPYKDTELGKLQDYRYTYDPEEICLAFVAITQAKDKLVIIGDDRWINACTREKLIMTVKTA